ncbi:MAG: UTP--glucose-1-phosphate uridylyltransferase GalU, partial [Thiotrichales bacterium]|nr:UTP--glucose-1-phosphate uridylyltransferase GalU [Thiotrichales bacterium]
RFLPATKASPKEMLPIVDKPLIQYAVEEAVAAGITDMIFVTGRTKNAIADHFDKAYELEAELEKKQKTALLELVQGIIPDNINCIYIRQSEALGLGHAVLCALPAVGNEPFAVSLADDLIDDGKRGCLKQMVDVYAKHQGSVLAVMQVPKQDTGKYGIVSSEPFAPKLEKMTGIVEKPSPETAPTTLAVVGRYILTPGIFSELKSTKRGAGNEIQLTDAIEALLKKENVFAYEFAGTRYDCGSKIGYLQATIEYGLKHPELHREFSEYLSGFTRN